VVSGSEDATVKETTGGAAAARRGDVATALPAQGGGVHDEDGCHDPSGSRTSSNQTKYA
jgi:hypothetical protein